MSKRYDDPIEVACDGDPATPLAFVWRGRSYSIDQHIAVWREATWPVGNGNRRSLNGQHVECFRVLAHQAGVSATGDLDADGFLVSTGAVYDLQHSRDWRLVRVWD